MCGIIHCKKTDITKKAKNTIIKRFEAQRSRGVEGFGYVEIKNGIVSAEVRTQTEKEIMEKLKESTADEILFHHRIPTSTPNFIEATHPIKVSHPSLKYNYYVIHNGIITNDDELKAEHIKAGFVYTTSIRKEWKTRNTIYFKEMYNDSESLAIDFALAIEQDIEIKAKGSIAIIALQFEKETGKAISLYWGHNVGNPMKYEQTKEMLCISSESGTSLPTDRLYRLDYATDDITYVDKKIGTYRDYFSNNYTGFGAGWLQDTPTTEYLEESDYVLDKREEIIYLEEQLMIANQNNDYDSALEIELEIDELKIELYEAEKALKDF